MSRNPSAARATMAPWAVPLASRATNLAMRAPRLSGGGCGTRGAGIGHLEAAYDLALAGGGEREEVRLVVEDLLAVGVVVRVAEALVLQRAQGGGDLGRLGRARLLGRLGEEHHRVVSLGGGVVGVVAVL